MNADDKLWSLMLGNMKTLREENAEAHTVIQDLLKAQNSRIRKLENWRVYLVGIAFGAAGAVSLLARVFTFMRTA